MFSRVTFGCAIVVLVVGRCGGDELAKVVPDDNSFEDQFGYSVAIRGGIAAAGAVGDKDKGEDAGSAYLFDVTDAAHPVQLAKLVPEDLKPDDEFGRAVALGDGFLVVGSWRDDSFGQNAGSLYLFDISDPTAPVLIKEIGAEDADPNDFLGRSVAVSGSLIVAGADGDDEHGNNAGAAYVFDAETGEQLTKLVGADITATDHFGWCVGISGTTVVVGAPYDDRLVTDAHNDEHVAQFAGSAYLFDALSGKQIAKLVPPRAYWFAEFGIGVAIDGDLAVVGAMSDGTKGTQAGAAYVFNAHSGALVGEVFASDGGPKHQLGQTVALDRGVALIGSRGDDTNGFLAGAAYFFDVSVPSRPIELSKVVSSDGASSDSFGFALALAGSRAIVGAYSNKATFMFSGAAYMFGTPCKADVNGDGELNVLDFVAFQGLWQAGEPAGDCDGNGAFNVLDFVCFQLLFQGGCG